MGRRAESLKAFLGHRRSEGGRVRWLGVLVLLGLVLLEGASPGAVALPPSSGVWIFPHDNQAAVLLGEFSDSFYTGEHGDPELNYSFYGVANSSSANVRVDFYNPGLVTILNIQVWAAVTFNHSTYFNSMSFSGSVCGDLDYPDLDSLSVGTPLLSDLTPLDGHGVFPAHYANYCIGNLNAGAIKTIWVNVSGDFESGLIIHVDYSGENDLSEPYQGPFDADMNIWKPPPEATSEVPAEPPHERRSSWADFGFSTTEFGTQFFDASEPPQKAVAWDWSFGDGFGSRKQNPTHIYTCQGVYPVSLVVADESGEQASVSALITITEDRPSCGIFQRTETGIVLNVNGAPLSVPTAAFLFLFVFSFTTLALEVNLSGRERPFFSRRLRVILLWISGFMLLYTTGALAAVASTLQRMG